jgi:hypothetical protein
MQRWRILHFEELHNLYSLLGIIRMITSKTIEWEGHVARMGRTGTPIGFGGEVRRKGPLGRPRFRRRIIVNEVCICRGPFLWLIFVKNIYSTAGLGSARDL